MKINDKKKQEIAEREELEKLARTITTIDPEYLEKNFQDIYNKIYYSDLVEHIYRDKDFNNNCD